MFVFFREGSYFFRISEDIRVNNVVDFRIMGFKVVWVICLRFWVFSIEEYYMVIVFYRFFSEKKLFKLGDLINSGIIKG